MENSILRDKSFKFALRVIKLSKYLQNTHKEYILSKQIIRSGTSVGPLIREANETEYWLLLLFESNYIDEKMFNSIQPDIKELLKLLISSTKTVKAYK